MPWPQIPVVSHLLANYACETAALRPLQIVGFPPHLGVILSDHYSTNFGTQYTACGLATPGFRHLLAEIALGFATRLLAKLWLGGI